MLLIKLKPSSRKEEQRFVTTISTSKTHVPETLTSPLLFSSMEDKHISFYSFPGIVPSKVTNEWKNSTWVAEQPPGKVSGMKRRKEPPENARETQRSEQNIAAGPHGVRLTRHRRRAGGRGHDASPALRWKTPVGADTPPPPAPPPIISLVQLCFRRALEVFIPGLWTATRCVVY